MFESVWERVKAHTSLGTFVELAEFVGTTQPTVSKNKAKDIFPVEWAYKIAQEHKLFTDWLMTGKGPRSLADLPQAKGPVEEWLEDLRKEKGDTGWITIEMYTIFPEFKEWLEKKRKSGLSTEEILSRKSIA